MKDFMDQHEPYVENARFFLKEVLSTKGSRTKEEDQAQMTILTRCKSIAVYLPNPNITMLSRFLGDSWETGSTPYRDLARDVSYT